ncbi:MAG: DUF1667 domain-containing protein [Ruthenibacterium sp.]
MDLTCIVCPQGCRMTAVKTEKGITVTGNTCPRGAKFAESELTNPMRSVTTTVASALPGIPVLPVRTDGEVPKSRVPDVLRACGTCLLTKAARCGDIVIKNVADTGVDMIATRTTQNM